MKRWRHLVVAAWLALALVAGQQLVLLHALGHAADRMANKDSDAPAGCKLHFACSQLASAVGAKAVPSLPPVVFSEAIPASRTASRGAAPIVAFLSRGPPSPIA
jgi:hypothetical protein